MALKGLDIFKLSPKTNCKECGCPTCMAFSMKVAQGALSLDKCPHMSAEALSKLSAATEPPMKTISVGEHKLGGETVMLRHEKTLVNRNLYGIFLCANMDDAEIDKRIAESMAVDYERIGERMFVEVIYVNAPAEQSPERCAALAKKAAETGRDLVIEAADADRAKAALEAAGAAAKVLAGANAANWEAFNALAAGKLVLGVKGADLSEIHDTVEKLEGAGNKNLILDVTGASIKEAFTNAMQVRRAALKGGDRTFGYPSIVNTARLARGDSHMQAALASMFTLRYGSIVVLDSMSYAEALPLYGLRQNIFTDPQKPMKVEPGVYPLNGADENSICCVTVDFALTYFVVSGELERSGVPINMFITDAGGYSVLTSWAAGKFSAGTIEKFFKDFDIDAKYKNKVLILPGKVAVLKGELEARLPDWRIVVGTTEAIQLVRFLREFK